MGFGRLASSRQVSEYAHRQMQLNLSRAWFPNRRATDDELELPCPVYQCRVGASVCLFHLLNAVSCSRVVLS